MTILITVYKNICFGCVKDSLLETFLLRAQNLCLIRKKQTDNTHFLGLHILSVSLLFELLIIQDKISSP